MKERHVRNTAKTRGILCLLMAIVLLCGCGGNKMEKKLADGVAQGDYHVLIPEGENVGHADGTFQDFDGYCVYTSPEYIMCGNFSEAIYEMGYEWCDEIYFDDDEAAQEWHRYQIVLNDETYYLEMYFGDTAEDVWRVTMIAGKKLPDWNEGWLLAGILDGKVPELITEDSFDFAQAVAEPLEEGTVYTFEGVGAEKAADYGDALLRSGEWYPMTGNYDNPTDGNRYIEEFCSVDGEHRLIIAYGDQMKVITGNKSLSDIPEGTLWAMLGAPAMPGEYYMMNHCPGFPIQAGTGTGYDSGAGVAYSWNENASASDFDSMCTAMQDKGFIEDAEEYEENGQKIFVAWAHRDYGGFGFRFYTKLILDGTYLEVQVGTTGDAGSHR